MSDVLRDRRVASLAADGVERVELEQPREAVEGGDKLRMDERAVEFVREFFDSGKPIGSICHGPWTLLEAGVLSEDAID
jgi:transcriptional regulator GlxA family with amidase domain